MKKVEDSMAEKENIIIVATPLPQLEENSNRTENKQDTNWGNTVATIQLPRFTLSWSHYLVLMRIENIEARSFYEIEAAQQQWFLVTNIVGR